MPCARRGETSLDQGTEKLLRRARILERKGKHREERCDLPLGLECEHPFAGSYSIVDEQCLRLGDRKATEDVAPHSGLRARRQLVRDAEKLDSLPIAGRSACLIRRRER